MINRGNYFYAYSHLPYWALNIPEETYVFTCLRDPVDRVLSHYRMLIELKTQNTYHPCMRVEGKWLGDSLQDFIKIIPKEHLLNQLYMFSKEMNIYEAYDKLQEIDRVMFTKYLDIGLSEMSADLGITLKYQHRRKSPALDFDEGTISYLRELLDLEYKLLELVIDSEGS